MSELLEQPINTSKAMRLFVIAMLLFCLCPVLINCIALVPLYSVISTDALYSSSVLPAVTKYIMDFLDLAAFSFSYALIIFAVLLLSKKHARAVVIIYTLVFFIKIPVKLVMNIFVYGSLGSATDIAIDLIYMGVYFALEMLQLLVIYLFATTDTNKYLQYVAFTQSKKNKRGKNKSEEVNLKVLPLTRFINLFNPLQRSAFKMGLLVCGIKILTRVANDIMIGAPTSFGEVLIMAVYYLSDLLYGVVAYVIALLVFNVVYDRLRLDKNEKNTNEDVSSSVLDN